MRTCLRCKHWQVTQGDYNQTGVPASFTMRCLKVCWGFDPFEDDERSIRIKLEMAKDCEAFDLRHDFTREQG